MSFRNTTPRHDALGRYRGKHRAASTNRNGQAATLLGGGVLAAVVGLSGAAGAGAATTSSAKPTSYKTFDDGHGGTNVVKTRADGSVVKTSSKGEVLYDSAKTKSAGGDSSSTGSASGAKSSTSAAGTGSASDSSGAAKAPAGGSASTSTSASGKGANVEAGSSKPANSSGGATEAGKPTFKTFNDGQGGTTTVKTRADGSVVKTSSKGEVLYDSAKTQAATGDSSAAGAKAHAAANPLQVADDALSKTKQAQTATTAAVAVAQGRAGDILNTPVGSAAAKDGWSAAQKAAGTAMPDVVSKSLTAYSLGKNVNDFAQASGTGDYMKSMRSGGGAVANAASLGGAGVAATAGNLAWQGGLTVGDKVNTYTKDTSAVQDWQTKTGQHMAEGNQLAVVGDTFTLGGAVIKGAVQKMLGTDPATNAQQSQKGQGSNGSTGSNGSGSDSNSGSQD